VLLAVIAEKTGYPVEMLEPTMTLDADLGIDSIKRVEILSALQEQLPEAPPVKPEDLGVLQTIGQIVDHLAAASAPAAPPVTAPAPLESGRVAAVLLAVIAEKTGYPEEMLETGMTLDADLGIDSIKRVEILSALQDQLPEAPPIKPEHLGTLQTIGQIVDFLTSVSGGAETPSQTAPQDKPLPTGTGIERLELRSLPLPVEANRLPLKLAVHGRVWVTADGSPLTAALGTELNERGLVAETVDIRQADSLAVPDDLAGLLILAPAGGSDSRFLADAFRLLQRVEPALLAASRRGGAALATVTRLNGHFGLAAGGPVCDPLSGGLAGLSKTAGQEWSGVNCRAFDLAADLADDRDTARRLLDELLADGAVETGLTGDGLTTLELVASTVADEPDPLPVGYGDVVVVSGGGRGVTAATAVALARASHATLLLLGRSPQPQAEPAWLDSLQSEAEIKKALLDRAEATLTPKQLSARCQAIFAGREIRATLQQIKEAGGQPLYRCVDLRDGAAVADVLNDIRAEYGPIRALVHGAGVLADRLIKDKTPEQFASVYATKVDGLRNLLAAVDNDELRGLVLFSSSTGRYGRKGQVDYALANEVLNKVAWQQAALRPDCRVLALNWGPWDGGMVTPALKKVFADEGVPLIDLQAGADTLVRELATPPGGPVELVILGAPDQAAGAPAQQHENIYVTKAFDLDLSVASCPFLAAHVIDGKAVLPMALMIEWLAHAAIHNNPGLRFHGFNDLRVLKGVTLDHDQTHTLQAMTGKAFKSDGMHLVPVELSGSAGGRQFVHARAKIILANKLPAGKPAMPRADLAAYPHPLDAIYQPGRLFHGRQFQGIREVLGCAAAGIASLVRPAPTPAEWLSQPMRTSWLADPLALDCSFQLMILWSFENCKAGSLPVSAGRYRQYRERFPDSGTEIRIAVGRHSDSRALAEIDFVDPQSGELIARIEDYECVIDASLSAGFQRNRLRGVA
ncbi:MAG: SDR family NAD(P)-dependent oxidoreductase, partial [Desulfuromonadales bacterium]|nr:SDR family NAD(P)-dependent oxidoreductase [Desulfuromonadales bacterium]